MMTTADPPVATDSIRVAVVVDATLPLGWLANTVATLSIGLGAAHPGLGGHLLRDATGREFHCSANRPVPVLQASSETLRDLMLRALPGPSGARVIPFPRFAREIQVFEDYRSRFGTIDLATEIIDGIALLGPQKWVRSLTGSLKLPR